MEKKMEAVSEEKRKINAELDEERETSASLRIEIDSLEASKSKLSK